MDVAISRAMVHVSQPKIAVSSLPECATRTSYVEVIPVSLDDDLNTVKGKLVVPGASPRLKEECSPHT